jgi:hypothetical protein
VKYKGKRVIGRWADAPRLGCLFEKFEELLNPDPRIAGDVFSHMLKAMREMQPGFEEAALEVSERWLTGEETFPSTVMVISRPVSHESPNPRFFLPAISLLPPFSRRWAATL